MGEYKFSCSINCFPGVAESCYYCSRVAVADHDVGADNAPSILKHEEDMEEEEVEEEEVEEEEALIGYPSLAARSRHDVKTCKLTR